MLSFAFLLKTYRGDEYRAKRLVASWNEYNVENLKMFILCPEDDVTLFKNLETDNIRVIEEEKIDVPIFEEDARWNKGYLNQEIYKLAFREKGLCANYMCIDSDALFIRPFYKWEFMYDDETPYTSLEEDNVLRADYYYNNKYWHGRREWISKKEDEMNFYPCHLLTCRGFQIFSCKVFKSLKEDFMKSKGYDYKNLIKVSPYEFSWYNLWLQKTKVIDIHQIECLFKYFHLKQYHIGYVLFEMKLEDWAEGNVGIRVHSNYGLGVGDYYDLSVYDGDNAVILDDIIDMDYNFYKRRRKGRVKRKSYTLLFKVKAS